MLFIGVASRQAKPTQSGFTIFELMVVLVILAILSTVALPNLLSGMRREQLAATSLEIVNWLERARNQAVKDMEHASSALQLMMPAMHHLPSHPTALDAHESDNLQRC